jgi:hypothetical protein
MRLLGGGRGTFAQRRLLTDEYMHFDQLSSFQNDHSTMMGHVYDRFTARCASAKYLRERRILHSAGKYHTYTHTCTQTDTHTLHQSHVC